MEENLRFLPLLAVLLLSFVVPVALSRLRWLPLVVAEILIGILIGPSFLKLVGQDPTLAFFAEIGLALLMFLSGLEIDFNLLTRQSEGNRHSRIKLISISSFLMTLVLASLVGWRIVAWGSARDPFMIALILSTTSLGVVVPVMKERGLSGSSFGQVVLLSALLADFLTMFLITVYAAFLSHGLSVKILVIGILFVVALIVYRLGLIRIRRLHLNRVLADLARTASQVKIHGSMALMLTFVILAKFVGAEMILGAFLAGAVFSLLDKPADQLTRHRLDAIGFGFFVPLFFIHVGIGFDLPALVRDRKTLILAPLLLAAAFLIKLLAALVMRISFSWRKTFAGGFLLSSRLSLIIAASGIGLSMGVIQESTNAAFILVAAVTSTLAPILFNSLIPIRKVDPEKTILICGVNDTALQVARELSLRGSRVCFLVLDPEQREIVTRASFDIVTPEDGQGDLSSVFSSSVRSLMLLDASDNQNLSYAQSASALHFPHVIGLVNNPARLADYRSLGVQTFTPALFQPTLLAFMASNPDFFALLSSTREDHQVRELVIENRELSGRRLQDLQLGGDLLILSLRRGRERIIPHGKTRLSAGDRLTVLGSRGASEEFALLLKGDETKVQDTLH